MWLSHIECMEWEGEHTSNHRGLHAFSSGMENGFFELPLEISFKTSFTRILSILALGKVSSEGHQNNVLIPFSFDVTCTSLNDSTKSQNTKYMVR